jgi:nickel-dependent lactate racemase
MSKVRNTSPSGPDEIRPGRLAQIRDAEIEAAWSAAGPGMDSLSGTVTVVINDVTRAPVSGALLKPVAGMLEGRCRVLVATGTHRKVTEAEKDALLCGLLRDEPWRCTEAGEGWPAGTTSFGTDVVLDPWVCPGSSVLLVGSVEPHYFAGFTGGRKSILPGCAAEKTIVQNHYLACLPGSAPAALEGNPVSEDMLEAAGFVLSTSRIVCASCAVQGGRIVQFSVGEMRPAFGKSVEASRAACCLSLDRRYRSVVARPGAPLDQNLYQAMKALYNCEDAVEDGGTLLLDCHCAEGLGAAHMESSFQHALDPRWTCPTRGEYSLGDHSTARLVRIRKRIRLALHSLLDEDLVRRMGFECVENVDETVASDRADSIVIPDAGTVVAVACRDR